ncbi:E3 ubiquitin-protein ligase CCNB1IP1 [Nosema granulosis]|uniref:E3 ubiquitin-protein ligase CCNB1IP1 n=1 Tax=Nosema granulosis TaxID=83296 RepID=A0A9P6KZZ4_9MICR|nr:E3 ubiquitin-protein ligase CCNB1IP1 [Nosema granulosis]
MLFRCNNIKCRRYIDESYLVTICSHVFCGKCMIYIKKLHVCMVCSTKCNKEDIVTRETTDSTPTVEFEPLELLEGLRSSFLFYKYQLEQEIKILNSVKMEYEKSVQDKETLFIKEYAAISDKYSRLKKLYEIEKEERLKIYNNYKILEEKFLCLVSKIRKSKYKEELLEDDN